MACYCKQFFIEFVVEFEERINITKRLGLKKNVERAAFLGGPNTLTTFSFDIYFETLSTFFLFPNLNMITR